MSTNAQPTDNSPGGYKSALMKLEKLRGRAGGFAYERINLAVEVFEDRDFRADLGNLDDFRAAEFLDQYFEDLALEFLQLRALLEHFPDRKQWASGKLATMRREMLEARGPEQEPVSRNRVSWKTRAEELEVQIETLNAELDRLRRENQELRRLVAESPTSAPA